MPGTPAGLKSCLDGLTSDLPGGHSDEDVDVSDIEEAGGIEDTGESPYDAGEEEEAQTGKTMRGKPKRKAKAKANVAAAGKRKGKAPVAPPAVDANWKKCNDCKKVQAGGVLPRRHGAKQGLFQPPAVLRSMRVSAESRQGGCPAREDGPQAG